jgi:nitrite reductase/ring-hydroxylating ferredoxin subunit
MTAAGGPSWRLRRYVGDLIRGRRPRPYRVGPDEAAQIAVAVDLSNARPGAADPDENFLAHLHERLAAGADAIPPLGPATDLWRRRTSRRDIVIAATAGTAAVAGVAAGVALDRGLVSPDQPATAAATLSPNNGIWYTVVRSADLPENAIRRFNVGTVIGFVRRTGGQVMAVSGICSHQGCQLRLDNQSRELRCPCHSAAFAPDGVILRHQLPVAPPTLPAILAREIDGQVQVFAPAG